MHQLSLRKRFEEEYKEEEFLLGRLYQDAIDEFISSHAPPRYIKDLSDVYEYLTKMKKILHGDRRLARVPLDITVSKQFEVRYVWIEQMSALCGIADNVIFERMIESFLDLPENYMGRNLHHKTLKMPTRKPQFLKKHPKTP